MEFYTRITLPKAAFTFSHQEQIILLGSCFAENIGNKLADNKFIVDINPFGILYNPASVALAIRRLLCPQRFTSENLFEHEGVYHSFMHHSSFSSPSEANCLNNLNTRLEESSENIRKISHLIITWGTAWVYHLRSTGEVVSNCHKLPENTFDRTMLSIEDIIIDWNSLLLSLWEQNPELKILFTVSPIRHWKDGAHGNQLSKATLLLAINQLQQTYPGQIDYFPTYEIMMDELRDYRFYADDMLHPSSLAIEYIWEHFSENRLSKESLEILKEWNDIRKAINHKPFQPESKAYKQFILQTLLKMERINKKMPSFELSKEMEIVRSKLK